MSRLYSNPDSTPHHSSRSIMWLISLGVFSAFLVTLVALKNTGGGGAFFGFFSWIPNHDKVGHFFLMGVLAFLSVTTLSPRLPYPPGKATLALIMPLIAVITIEEASQHFIQSRSFSLLDLACSIAGVLALTPPAHLLVRETGDDQ